MATIAINIFNTTQKLQGSQAFTHVSVANNEGAKQTYHCLGAKQISDKREKLCWEDFTNIHLLKWGYLFVFTCSGTKQSVTNVYTKVG